MAFVWCLLTKKPQVGEKWGMRWKVGCTVHEKMAIKKVNKTQEFVPFIVGWSGSEWQSASLGLEALSCQMYEHLTRIFELRTKSAFAYNVLFECKFSLSPRSAGNCLRVRSYSYLYGGWIGISFCLLKILDNGPLQSTWVSLKLYLKSKFRSDSDINKW